ncbi:MAG TPA: helix-hairpin-helix domain-containing protein [Kofleriaceae bacterium]|jgi:competence protein ComEA
MTIIKRVISHAPAALAVALLVIAMGGSWHAASAAPPVSDPAFVQSHPQPDAAHVPKSAHKELSGKLNLNAATEDQLMLLPKVGPAKAERIVAWRKKNGGFKRIEDLRRVKGFGYKTFKRLQPYLDIKGDTTLAAK